MTDLVMAAEKGVPFVLHAHGDNVKQWIELLEVLILHKTPLILTHQTPEVLQEMHNLADSPMVTAQCVCIISKCVERADSS